MLSYFIIGFLRVRSVNIDQPQDFQTKFKMQILFYLIEVQSLYKINSYLQNIKFRFKSVLQFLSNAEVQQRTKITA